MAGISSAGIGSGLDINSLVTQLMNAERQPLNALSTKKSQTNQKISAFGQIKGAISSLQSALSSLKSGTAFDVFKATSSDSKIASATANSNAAAGSYDITVSKLAKSRVEGTTSGLFNQSTAPIGTTGTLTFTVGAKSFSVNVTNTDTLESVRDAINNVTYDDDADASTPDKTQALVQASVVNVGTSGSPDYKLIFTSTGKGSDGAVTIGGTAAAALGLGDYTTSDPDPTSTVNTSLIQRENDTQAVVNGVNITRSSNTIDDVIAGATITLAGTGSTTISISRDTDAITAKVNEFISAYNKLQSTVTDLRKKGGTLEADSSALSVVTNLQSTFNAPANIAGTNYKWLAEIGVSFQKDGSLALDATKFSDAIKSNFAGVKSLFSDSTDGFATRIYDAATAMLNTDGLISSRTSGLNATLKSLDDRIDQMDARLTRTEARLRAQFSSLDSLLGTMKNTSSYLSRL